MAEYGCRNSGHVLHPLASVQRVSALACGTKFSKEGPLSDNRGRREPRQAGRDKRVNDGGIGVSQYCLSGRHTMRG